MEEIAESSSRGETSEEKDLLVQSTKRAKVEEEIKEHEDTVEEMVQNLEDLVKKQGEGNILGEQIQRNLISYKDKLVGFNGATNSDNDEQEDLNMELEEECKEDPPSDENEGWEGTEDPTCPIILVSREEKEQLCKPWKLALIVKLLGKRLGMRFLQARLQRMWAPKGSFEFIDMENDHYLIRFSDIQDYNYVLQEGPWVIADHYLIVQRWKPNFDPFEDNLWKIAVWARIPGLPIEFYNKHFLWRVGNRIG